MSPAELLQFVSMHHKDGTIQLQSNERQLTLIIGSGRLLCSSSSDVSFHLSEFLVSRGYITQQERTKAIEVQHDTGTSLGAILVAIGVLSRIELLQILQRKATEEIHDMFGWKGGEFAWYPDELPSVEMIPMQMDLMPLVLEVAKRHDEAKRSEQPSTRADAFYFALRGKGSTVRRYHAQHCKQAPPSRRSGMETFDSKREAEQLGLVPCKSCKP